ncbi:MFS transporter [Salmonella enterica]|nr:MFS transporter [Salmonella enterica]ECR3289594.1 MFS transporter [Salmonella enterica]EFT3554441.1 MFS transporter [Salmonella enterica]
MAIKPFNYQQDFSSIDFRQQPELYQVGRGEQGVLLVEPYKSEILPFWRYKDEASAMKSAEQIYQLFEAYRQQVLEDAELRAWGWRIPFALGAVLAVVALWLRRQLDETSKHETRALKEAGSLKGLWRNRKAFLMVLGFTAAGSLCFYTFTTYMQKYLVNTAGMHANVASGIMTVALCVFMLVQPLFGALSDKIGRRTSMLCFGALATLFTVPILSALQNVTSPYAAFALVMCALLIVSFYTSISGILKAEMFPAQVRALGVGLSYAVANALFGGSAEYVALSLKSVGMESSFFWYVTAMAVLAFLVSLMLHRKGKGLRL